MTENIVTAKISKYLRKNYIGDKIVTDYCFSTNESDSKSQIVPRFTPFFPSRCFLYNLYPRVDVKNFFFSLQKKEKKKIKNPAGDFTDRILYYT